MIVNTTVEPSLVISRSVEVINGEDADCNQSRTVSSKWGMNKCESAVKNPSTVSRAHAAAKPVNKRKGYERR